MTLTLEYNPKFHGKGVLDHQKSDTLVMPRKNFGGLYENTTVQKSSFPVDSLLGADDTTHRDWLWRAATVKVQVVENFIHPVLRVYKREAKSRVPELLAVHHVMEDLHTLWELESTFKEPARKFIADNFRPSLTTV